MPIVIVVVAVIAIVILARSGVPASVLAMTVPLIFSTLGGLATAGIVSAFATPVVGVPAGLMIGVYLFAKLASR
ncbi:TPA: hypothetical protein O4G41_004748 [Vibrio alginolyticus]|uniref:hypothetical protein n=1 Tax=Vibrio TaxID=662 RepID=UPI001F2C7EEB|nr:hypothetical protein [Vibrio sp. D54]MCF7510883.1 hypothetical protein [Vibrio sp. D54]HCZ9047748.1 hypothetical protein [Vibrio alginolyticus]HCZ9302934.1 hypothetical protein [Vibrio alginolyticus]